MLPPALRRSFGLTFCVAAALAGWSGGRWAHTSLLPVAREPAVPGFPVGPATLPGSEPRVAADSPAAQWMARAKAADEPGDFAGLLDDPAGLCGAESGDDVRRSARAFLLGLWIRKDAAAAADYVRARQAGKDIRTLGTQFGQLLGEIDPANARELLDDPQRGSLGPDFLTGALYSLATYSPRDFFDLRGAGLGEACQRWWPQALGVLARSDPAAAAARLEAHGLDNSQGVANVEAIATEWAAQNQAAARKWVESLTDPGLVSAGLDAWLSGIARRDPQSALRELMALPSGRWTPTIRVHDGSEITDVRIDVLSALARNGLAPALEAWTSLAEAGFIPPGLSTSRMGRTPDGEISRAIARAALPGLPDEPGALLSALATLAAGTTGAAERQRAFSLADDVVLAKAAMGWPVSSTLETVSLLLASGPTSDDGELLSGLLQIAVQADPMLAAGFVGNLPPEQRGEAAVETLKFLDATEDPALLQAVAANVPAGDWNGQFGSKFAAHPEVNAAFMANLPAGPMTDIARNQFSGDWARADPVAAAQWISTLPGDLGAIQAARGVADAWGRYDETAASAWADTLPPGPVRDGAALGLAASVSAAAPEEAWQWADSIRDPVLRADALINVAATWGSEATPAFRADFSAGLEAGGYAGAVRERFLQMLDKAPGPPTDTAP